MADMESKEFSEFQIPHPIHPGIREHFVRAVFFFNIARDMAKEARRFRMLMAAVYSCQAIVELMLEQANRNNTTVSRDELKQLLKSWLPHFDLIERIRIHDFHRYGLLPPNPGAKIVRTLGPLKLIAKRGAAVATYSADGPREIVTGDSEVKGQRPLHLLDDMLFDEQIGEHVTIETVVRNNLHAVPNAVKEFEKLLTKEGRNAHPTPELWATLFDSEP